MSPGRAFRGERVQPKRKRGARLCVVVRTDGVAVYGNQTAFESLAEWLRWIAKSPPKDHYECHLVWHFESYANKRHPKNVRVLFDERIAPLVAHAGKRADFDVTFI